MRCGCTMGIRVALQGIPRHWHAGYPTTERLSLEAFHVVYAIFNVAPLAAGLTQAY